MEGRFPREGRLALEGAGRVVAPAILPQHRVLTLTVRNVGQHAVRLTREDVLLIDDDGERLPAVVSIAPGSRVAIAPGEALELHFAWRVRTDHRPPAELRYGAEALVLGGQLTSARPS